MASKTTREPFHGYKQSMTLSNQLGLTDAVWGKHLGGPLSQACLEKAMSGCFIFRKFGDSKCSAVAPKSGRVSAWFFILNATPKQSSVVQKDSK